MRLTIERRYIEKDRMAVRQRDRQADRQRYRQRDSETHYRRQTDRQAERQVDRQRDRQTERLTIERLLISIFVMAAFSGAAKTCQGKILR